jgi:hypothetical protein
VLTTIKATLEDVEEKQFIDSAIKDWLRMLKNADHILDGILDECDTEALEMECKGSKCRLLHKVLLDYNKTSYNIFILYYIRVS